MVVKEKKTKKWIFVMITMLCSFQLIAITLSARAAVSSTNNINDIFVASSNTLLQTTTSSDGTTTTTDTALVKQNTEDLTSEQIAQATDSSDDLSDTSATDSSPVKISSATISDGVLSVTVNNAENKPIKEAVITVMGNDYYTDKEGGVEISVPVINGNVLVTARNSISSTSTYVQSNTDVTANTFANRALSKLKEMIPNSWFDTLFTRLLSNVR